MAQASNASSTVYLTMKEFPLEFESEYCARNQSPKQNTTAERVMVAGADRRQRIMADYTMPKSGIETQGFPGIGLLRTEFNGTYFIGTATLICKGNCVLTCAHNVVEYDGTTKKFVYPTSVWFELRENKLGSGSAMINRYKVSKISIYPPYFENPISASGFDLALCWINAEDDHTTKEIYAKYWNYMPIVIARGYTTHTATVVGFPGEHKGEKWGMTGDVTLSCSIGYGGGIRSWSFGYGSEYAGEILVYDFIDTSPGQSGSPVVGLPTDILGVHTGGSASLKKNWATYITPTKFDWIANSLGNSGEVDTDPYSWYLR